MHLSVSEDSDETTEDILPGEPLLGSPNPYEHLIVRNDRGKSFMSHILRLLPYGGTIYSLQSSYEPALTKGTLKAIIAIIE